MEQEVDKKISCYLDRFFSQTILLDCLNSSKAKLVNAVNNVKLYIYFYF